MKNIILAIMICLAGVSTYAEYSETELSGGSIVVLEDKVSVGIDGYKAKSVQDVMGVFAEAFNFVPQKGAGFESLLSILTSEDAKSQNWEVVITGGSNLAGVIGEEKTQQLLDILNKSQELNPNLMILYWQ